LMACGGLVSLVDRRHRIGPPRLAKKRIKPTLSTTTNA